MRARASFGLAAILLVALVAAADDPWMGAAYEKWSEKDVQKVLKSSPWGHELVTATKARDKDDKSKQAVNRYDRPEEVPTEWVQIVWWSSKTVRRAVLRKAMLLGAKVPEDQAKQFTETPLEEHVIVVWGDPKTLATMARLEPAELKKAAYFESPRLKTRIEPADAGVEREGNTPPDKIIFRFARKLNGQEIVTSEDSRLVLKWRLLRNPKGKIEDAQQFEVVFNPSKMVSGGAADY